jgi:hypothetical protein
MLGVILFTFSVLHVATALVCNGTCQRGDANAIGMNKVMPLQEYQYSYCRLMGQCPTILPAVSGQHHNCEDGKMNVHEGYNCENVVLQSYLSTQDLGSAHDGNDIWGAQLVDNKGVLRFLAVVGLEGWTCCFLFLSVIY